MSEDKARQVQCMILGHEWKWAGRKFSSAHEKCTHCGSMRHLDWGTREWAMVALPEEI